MSSLIERQAAIETVRKAQSIGQAHRMLLQLPSSQPDKWEDTVYRKAVERLLAYFVPEERYAEAVDGLRGLPSAQPGWIPCDVRTPKHVEESYWICTDTGYQCQCRWTNNVFGLGARDEWGWKLLDIPQYSKVVAWQPLPTPYREGKKNE